MRAYMLALMLLLMSPRSTDTDRIIFLSEKPYGLFAMNADGSEVKQLVDSEQQVLHFDCGPKGIAYICDPSEIENFELYVLDAISLEQTSVFHGIRLGPAWSPDGERLAFMNHSGRWKIQVTAPSDYDECVELSPPANPRFEGIGFSANDGSPEWSPDGKTIVFYSNRSEKSLDLYSVELSTAKLTQLTKDVRAMSPTFSPDGSLIAFQSGEDIHIVSADGSGQCPLIQHEEKEHQVRWFADSKRILFTSERFGESELCVFNLEDESIRNLTNHPASDWSPALSKDEKRILFVSNRDGNDEIYVMEVDRKGVKRLTTNDVRDAAPAWLQ